MAHLHCWAGMSRHFTAHRSLLTGDGSNCCIESMPTGNRNEHVAGRIAVGRPRKRWIDRSTAPDRGHPTPYLVVTVSTAPVTGHNR